MLPKDDIPAEYRDRSVSTPQCESFMHLHLGIDRKVTLSILCITFPLERFSIMFVEVNKYY